MIPAVSLLHEANRKQPYVLLIEDEEAHAELIGRAFEERSEQMDWTVARSLSDARALIEESPPEVVITDLVLPDGKGLELLSANGSSRFPVVIMTGHGDERVAAEAIKAGALDYVVKSESSFDELPQIAEKVLCRWRHREEKEEAEKALSASERHYRELYDETPSMFLTVNASGDVVSANHFAARQLGYETEDLEGMAMSRLYTERDLPSAMHHLEACFWAADTLQRWEATMVRRDEQRLDVRVIARVVCSDRGER
ncbi:MAG: response regulator, partial [Acidobacteriota bacterium]